MGVFANAYYGGAIDPRAGWRNDRFWDEDGLYRANYEWLATSTAQVRRHVMEHTARQAAREGFRIVGIEDDPMCRGYRLQMVSVERADQHAVMCVDREPEVRAVMGIDFATGASMMNATTFADASVAPKPLDSKTLMDAVEALMPKERVKPPKLKKYDRATRHKLLRERIKSKQYA